VSYGEHKETHIILFKNHANFTCLPGKLTAVYGFQGAIKCQGGPFLGFAKAFSALIVRQNCQNGLPLRHGYVYYQLCSYVHRHVDNSPTLN